MDVSNERFMRNIVINAGLDRIARGERIEESVEEVFKEITLKLHTIDMLEFLARTRNNTSWVSEAYTIANSNKLGHYEVSRKEWPKRMLGVTSYTKPRYRLTFNYSWKPGMEQELERITKNAALIMGIFSGNKALLEDLEQERGMFRERFNQREFKLEGVKKKDYKNIDISPGGITLFSFPWSKERFVYKPQP